MRAKTPILVILVALLMLASPSMALFGQKTHTFKGRVNFVQPSNFTLLTDNNQLVRIIVSLDRTVPPEVQLGVVVEVKTIRGRDGFWYLDKFEKINLSPQPGDL